jgi:hypothetical protein
MMSCDDIAMVIDELNKLKKRVDGLEQREVTNGNY